MTPTPKTAWSAWLQKRNVTSEELADRTQYSLPAIKSWRRRKDLGSARMPQLGALYMIVQALVAIARARGISEPEIKRNWTLTPSRLAKLMRAPACRAREPKP